MVERAQDPQARVISALQRNTALFQTICRISMIGLALLALLHILLSLFEPAYPWTAMVTVNLVSLTSILISRRILARGQLTSAVVVYLGAVILTLVASLVSLGGAQSPLTKAFIVVVLFAGLLGKKNSALWVFLCVLAIIVIQLILTIQGIIQPPDLQNRALMLLDSFVLVVVIVVTLVLTTRVVRNNEEMENILLQKDEALSTAIRRASIAQKNEQETSQRERVLIAQLHQLSQRYVAYLEQISHEDYSTGLVIQDEEYLEVPELLQLGHSLRNTIENLHSRIEEADTAQMMYIQRAWESFVEQGTTPSGYAYKEAVQDVQITPNSWLPVMNQALATKGLAIDDAELGIPLNLGGAVIGALGLKRKEHSTWTEDEVTMIQDIVDQLTQTLERLRLVDDISKRAALEATASKVTANIRTEVDIEAVLKRALAELGVALQADRGYAQLSFVDEREDAK
jgi:GAF domain-containing protein